MFGKVRSKTRPLQQAGFTAELKRKKTNSQPMNLVNVGCWRVVCDCYRGQGRWLLLQCHCESGQKRNQ